MNEVFYTINTARASELSGVVSFLKKHLTPLRISGPP